MRAKSTCTLLLALLLVTLPRGFRRTIVPVKEVAAPALSKYAAESFLRDIGVQVASTSQCVLSGSNSIFSCDVLKRFLDLATHERNILSPPVEVLQDTTFTVNVYGGSVTCAAGVADSYHSIMVDLLSKTTNGSVQLQVNNYCTPASGPTTIMSVADCGFNVCDGADLIISEFSINSMSVEESSEWYHRLRHCDTPVIVLNLFSWLQGGPARPLPPAAMEAYFAFAKPHNMWLVDFSLATAVFWNQQEPFLPLSLFNHTGSSESNQQMQNGPLPDVCSTALPDIHPDCLACCPSSLQHGNSLYHQLAALSIAFSMKLNIPYVILKQKARRALSVQNNPLATISLKQSDEFSKRQANSRVCYGHWGSNPELLPQQARERVHELQSLLPNGLPENWHFGDPFARERYKDSLYFKPKDGDSIFTPLVFSLPNSTHSVKLGWVAHSAGAEVSHFMIRAGGSQIWNLTNRCETVAKVDIRVAEYKTFIVEKKSVADTLELIVQPTSGPFYDQPLEIIRIEYE